MHDPFFGCPKESGGCDRIGYPNRCGGTCGCGCDADGPIVRPAYRGDTIVFDFQVLQPKPPLDPRSTPPPQDVTGWSATFTLKYQLPDYDVQAIAQLTTGGSSDRGSLVWLTPKQGIGEVKINPIATRGFADSPVHLVYDVQVKDPGGNIFTVQAGYFVVRPDVTRAIS